MTNIKQWQSDQHDGMPQINGYFLFNFSELKTRKRKRKTTLVSFIYREKRKRKKKTKQKKNYFTSMTEIIGFQKWKRKEKKKNIYIYYCESISFEDSPAHISTRAPSVWYVLLPYDRATWSPKTQHPPPDPSHNTEIHGPQRQDVQKLVFNIKQCRPYCKQLSHPPHPFFTPPLQGLSLYEGWAEPTSTKWQENQTQDTGGGRKHTYRTQKLPLHHSLFFFFF